MTRQQVKGKHMHRTAALHVTATLALATAAAHAQDDFLAVAWTHFADQPEGKRICKFSPDDGAFLGYLTGQHPDTIIWVQGMAQGPDGYIYLADQVGSWVSRWDTDGNFVDFFLTEADGIQNIRGLAFDGEDLLVAHAPPNPDGATINLPASGIKRFGPGGQDVGFVAQGFASWDLHVTQDSTIIASKDGASFSDPIHFFQLDGTDLGPVMTVNWPTGFSDAHTPGVYYSVAYQRVLREIDDSGFIRAVLLALPSGTIPKDVYPLSNGNVLITTFSDGVHVIDPSNGTRVATVHEGYGFSNIAHVQTQAQCTADTNDDGALTPADFSAWIMAYNDRTQPCDQNRDSLCTPADFSAWISNYNAGC